MKAVYCPQCHKKLAEDLSGGRLIATCPRCHETVIVDRRIPQPVT